MRVKILEKATITHALFFFSFYYKFSYLAFSDLMLVNFDPFSTFLLVAGSRSGWGFLLIEWNSLASSNLLVPFHLLFQHSQAWFTVFILPQRDIGWHHSQAWFAVFILPQRDIGWHHSQAWFAVFILPQRDIGGHQCGYTNWNWGIINDGILKSDIINDEIKEVLFWPILSCLKICLLVIYVHFTLFHH
jgi:hypothetical protein